MSMMGNFVAVLPEQFAELQEDEDALMGYLLQETIPNPGSNALAIGKAWHGLHYLLNGTAWDGDPPLGLVVLGGEECGDDTGYGCPLFLEPAQVQEVSEALQQFDFAAAMTQHTPAELEQAQVYPQAWQEEQDLTWVADEFQRVVAFYRKAAEEGKVVIKFLA